MDCRCYKRTTGPGESFAINMRRRADELYVCGTCVYDEKRDEFDTSPVVGCKTVLVCSETLCARAAAVVNKQKENCVAMQEGRN